ncbi:small ribosomal subunit Rsm22 family protein [Pseudobacteriovorax antillogorgiicola]|uniref:Small ribosomal subunit Rsm22 n=1 Tax=Pseudobacteriovorax antillogorgiicola TaxID=1513793 RepID=A0A1Y6CHJ2_9BACT|nr:small ribosomal subunit Rsm22 family protein [Pseudobacteriovorax antillogorgiicola]TCS48350.1 small ribosomal subunit Rsm22 [Pseudobacteriovorax antillogorgiicola]SMF56281.1 small ribosomal subunit Rsm22 [Pseudobacteriovorax antillogorgiicola]
MVEINWQSLRDLRGKYVSQADSIRDYWADDQILSDYHETLGQRILWKWHSVLKLLQKEHGKLFRGPLRVKDFGCGTGVASLAFLEIFGTDAVASLKLFDRSPRAMSFARRTIQMSYPNVSLDKALGSPEDVDILLVSHVLTEMTESHLKELLLGIRRAKYVIWVEAGTHPVSDRLVRARDLLCDQFKVLAPCLHQKPCGMTTEENSSHWCHFFADVPQQVHHSAFWREFAKQLKVDLRSLPLSYVVLAAHDVCTLGDDIDQKRIIGRVREYKGYCRALLCDEAGVYEASIQKRNDKKRFKELCRGGFCLSL